MSLPNKFFEYLAYGLPIISSLKSEMDILINNKKLGCSYSSESPKSLALAIKKVNNFYKSKSFISSIKNEYKENFDGSKIYKEYAKFTKYISKEKK